MAFNHIPQMIDGEKYLRFEIYQKLPSAVVTIVCHFLFDDKICIKNGHFRSLKKL